MTDDPIVSAPHVGAPAARVAKAGSEVSPEAPGTGERHKPPLVWFVIPFVLILVLALVSR